MNKILIVGGEITESCLDGTVKVKVSKKKELETIPSVNITVSSNTDLKIECNNEETTKMEIFINVLENVNCNIYQYITGGTLKISYKYYFAENSKSNVCQINDLEEITEMNTFNLNGENVILNYNLKTISISKEKYDVLVYHNKPNTKSNIITEGVNIKNGNLKFNVSGFIPKGIKNCIVNQNNRIINLTNNNCQICPNLFIDEEDVVANHSAHIGKCNDNEIFYLMSRGITYKKAQNLLIRGFLLKNTDIMKKNMEKIINRYWR